MAEQQLFLTSGMNSWHAAEQGVVPEIGAHLSRKFLVDCSKKVKLFDCETSDDYFFHRQIQMLLNISAFEMLIVFRVCFSIRKAVLSVACVKYLNPVISGMFLTSHLEDTFTHLVAPQTVTKTWRSRKVGRKGNIPEVGN